MRAKPPMTAHRRLVRVRIKPSLTENHLRKIPVALTLRQAEAWRQSRSFGPTGEGVFFIAFPKPATQTPFRASEVK